MHGWYKIKKDNLHYALKQLKEMLQNTNDTNRIKILNLSIAEIEKEIKEHHDLIALSLWKNKKK
jgi:predicted negative regulator of RcsB-dependent stress response